MTGKHVLVMVGSVAIVIDQRKPSHFKYCVAIAMCLIVALCFSFPLLIETCWLFYCVVYSRCKITKLEKQDNRKCIFATDRILEQNSVRCAPTSKFVATDKCLIIAHSSAFFMFFWSAIFVFLFDIHKVSRL